ncbi:MAG: DUF6475 domain-containing protein [Burkholderiales bacterium]|jgi:hypothetical protein|nr:DUF6475 domain-containing protein [Burkholderiales bacterium]
MRVEDGDDFRKLLSGVYDFYAKDLSPFAFDVWWKAMSRFDLKAVQQAFDRHLMNPDTGQFIPKPADIVKMLAGRSVDSAQVAWSKVDGAVRGVGPYSSVVFDDPLIHRVIYEMGGWILLCQKTNDDWPFIANEFRTRYQGYKVRGEVPEYQSRMIGIFEFENSKNGYKHTEIAMIGDAEKAKIVHANGSNDALLPIKHIGDVLMLSGIFSEKSAIKELV